jgi:cytochrome b involved in lipid metabolism
MSSTSEQSSGAAATNTTPATTSVYDKKPGETEWTRKEVQEKSTAGGKHYMIIDNIVFDITEFADQHPGGSAVS